MVPDDFFLGLENIFSGIIDLSKAYPLVYLGLGQSQYIRICCLIRVRLRFRFGFRLRFGFLIFFKLLSGLFAVFPIGFFGNGVFFLLGLFTCFFYIYVIFFWCGRFCRLCGLPIFPGF